MSEAPRRILITGASGGLGRALATAYAAPGSTLFLHGRDPSRLTAVADECRRRGAEVETALLDVLDEAALQAWVAGVQERHPLDLLIANAGVNAGARPDGSLETWEEARQVLGVNLLAALATVAPVIEPMRRLGRGQIALMSSVVALRAFPSAPAYSASKAGVLSYGVALRAALAPAGVKVSVICPGYVETAMSARVRGPKPFLIPPERAALAIRRGLAANKPVIAFPWPLALGLRLLALLPAPLADGVLSRFAVTIGEPRG